MANQWVPFPEMLGSSEEEASLDGEKMMAVFIFYLPVQDQFEEFGGQVSRGIHNAGGSTGLALRGEVWTGEMCLSITSTKTVTEVQVMA